MEDAEGGEMGWWELGAGVVREAAVALGVGGSEWVLVHIGEQEGGSISTYGFIVVVEDFHV